MTKQQQLDVLANEVEVCKICKKGKSGKMVFGEGNPDANVVFIGEAPGKKEAATGRPFVGKSGKFLRGLIRSIGLKEEEVYITSPVKYSPDKGTPSKEDIIHARTHFLKQLEIIQPEIIVLLGSVAAQVVLGEKVLVSKVHGEIVERNGVIYLITFHPAAALRSPLLREEIEKDFQKLKNLL
jgi:DNA polymerase